MAKNKVAKKKMVPGKSERARVEETHVQPSPSSAPLNVETEVPVAPAVVVGAEEGLVERTDLFYAIGQPGPPTPGHTQRPGQFSTWTPV